MKKHIQVLATTLTIPSLMLPLMTLSNCSCSKSWVDPEIAAHDVNGWQHAIEHIANCKHPTIYLCATASVQIQQTINLYLASSLLAQELGHTYVNSEYKYTDNIFLAPFNRAYHYKTDTPIGNFGYKYSSLVNETFGFKDIIKYGVNNANNMIVTNLQDFDTSLSDYDNTKDDYCEYNSFVYSEQDNPGKGFAWIEKILDKIFSLYPDDTKFNIVWSDTDFANLSTKAKKGVPLDIMTKIFRKVDKFYTVSEGWLTFYRHDEYKEWYVNHGYTSYARKKDIWNTVKQLPYDDAKVLMASTDTWFQFMNCEEFTTVCSPGNDALLSSDFLSEKDKLTKETAIKPCYPWFLLNSYAKLFKNNEQSDFYKKFVNAFLDFYLFFAEGNQQKFDDYIINTAEIPNNFDSSKKNLIFLLPSFMGQLPLSECELVLKEYKKAIDKITIKYPYENWNYIYKFHPRAQSSLIGESLKIIFDGTIPNNSVVLKNNYPSEYLFALDQYLVKTGKETFYHLIDPNSLSEDKPNGIITGEDIVSTSVYTAMEILGNELGKDWNNVNKLIQIDAYYLPTTYSMGSTKMGDYKQVNRNRFNYLFKKFYEVGQFINPDSIEYV